MKTHPQKKQSIDIGLSVLCSLAKRDETLTVREIAEVCECSHETINSISRRAMIKARRHFQRMGVEGNE